MPSGSNLYKVTFSFQEASGSTFSEVYYCTGNNPSDITALPYTIIQQRLQLLDPSAAWRSIRVAQVGSLRITAQRLLNAPGTSTVNSGPAAPGAAVVWNLVAQQQGSRKLWMRGVPDGFINNTPGTGRPNPPGDMITTFNSFIGAMANFGFGMRTLASAPKIPIISVTNSSAPGIATITYSVPNGVNPPNFQTGSVVIISQADAKTLPGLKGRFQVTDLAVPNGLKVRYLVANNATILQNCGFVKLVSYNTFTTFNTPLCTFAYYGTHATRSIFTNSRGARRAARIRTLA